MRIEKKTPRAIQKMRKLSTEKLKSTSKAQNAQKD